LSYESGTTVSYSANGPAQNLGIKLRYLNDKIYFAHGGYDNVFQPRRNGGQVSVFEKGIWTQFDESVDDITDIQIMRDQKRLVSSFGYGVKAVDAQGNETVYDESNSSLVNIDPPGRFVNISSMLVDGADLWVANYGSPNSLHKMSGDGAWQSYDFPVFAAQFPLALERDYANRIWMRLNPIQGGGLVVQDPSTGEYRYLTEADNSGELPSRNVHAIESDRDGNIWVGTDRGAAYFFDAESDAVRPIVGNIYLLLDDRVTAIETDGGNRKWMGTERGVWLISPTGESSVLHFTTENSPLLSDKIMDIEIDQKSGEVFILTDKGLVSYRGDATEASVSSAVKIFPNPIHANYTGAVGISGLPTDADVKITDVSGRLVWQSRANGGSISWDARGANGKRVSTGIYLVFAATGNGSQSVVGKVAVVN
jgi:ligand-binding sensor domain-containing protein